MSEELDPKTYKNWGKSKYINALYRRLAKKGISYEKFLELMPIKEKSIFDKNTGFALDSQQDPFRIEFIGQLHLICQINPKNFRIDKDWETTVFNKKGERR